MTIAGTLNRRSLELQFWGYETGNIVAAVTGAGGVALLWDGLRQSVAPQGPGLLAGLVAFPDAFATLGIVAIVVLGTPVIGALRRSGRGRAADLACGVVTALALAVLMFVLAADAGWLTLSASAFVLASCLLRCAGSFPLLLKLGGLGIAVGGVALTGAAVALFGAEPGGALGQPVALATGISGIYVTIAGLLTWRGGCFVSAGAGDLPGGADWLTRLLHPAGRVGRATSALLDRPLAAATRWIAVPALFWIPAHVIATRPFLTSMLARLPWRVLTATLCLASGTAAGISFAIANLLWAIGDVAIGALDFQPEDVRAAKPPAGASV
jgi:hypothetical protein